MSTVLFWLAVGGLFMLYLTIKKTHRERRLKKREKQAQSLESTRCAHCGVFVPKELAVRQHQQDFCSWEHAAQWHQEQQND